MVTTVEHLQREELNALSHPGGGLVRRGTNTKKNSGTGAGATKGFDVSMFSLSTVFFFIIQSCPSVPLTTHSTHSPVDVSCRLALTVYEKTPAFAATFMSMAMESCWRTAESYPALITRAVLDAYAQYVVACSNSSDVLCPDNAVGAETHGVPKSIQEALAPLEVLYGKTALSAIGIALHGTEPVIRYVERAEVNLSNEEDSVKTSDGDVECMHNEMPCARRCGSSATAVSSQVTIQRARCLYQVGDHTLFSPHYCPCSAYAYQSIQRQEVWCCKHMLALQLALRIEATGVMQDNLCTRTVSPSEYEQLLLRSLQDT
ncbi:hypothetical protein, conserved [Leishmania tarentolae]|uniref:SWIM-type domain-containing protein n=1 Tax=Leishmania tarentolae TaxID=5689 RepID=A0A640KWQ9_LEITA|nr:hypothetical protein, conserved [Leishmania tarentolae]